MTDIPEEVSYLLQQIQRGRAFLLLGAGASATSRNSSNLELKQSEQLAELIASESGYTYAGESLSDVVQACVGRRMSDVQYHQILQREFTRTKPSKELVERWRGESGQ